MHFDDRLATVLRLPAKGEVIARVQYRQLLDLLGTLPPEAHSARIDLAYARLSLLSRQIPAAGRTRMLRESGLRLRNPRLVAMLAESEPDVATAAISGAALSEDQWLDLVPALPVRARGILRHRRDLGPSVEARLARLGVTDRGLPQSESARVAAGKTTQPSREPDVRVVPEETAKPELTEKTSPGIGAIVERIEAFRRERQTAPATAPPTAHDTSTDSPRLPLGDGTVTSDLQGVSAFSFSTNGEGRIDWADPEVAPMVVGVLVTASQADAPADGIGDLPRLHRQRQPIRAARIALEGAPAIEGEWQIDASSQFDSITGRFTGYFGMARRAKGSVPQADVDRSEGDQMRQVLHELRTPANAIQMSAEVIQQQLYGPTPHEYRALAAAIASDTARLLAGFEELDRLIKLDSGSNELVEGESDLCTIVAATVFQMRVHTDPRKSGYALKLHDEKLPLALAPAELERLIWRLLAALAGAAAPSEVLVLDCLRADDSAQMSVELPAALAALSDEDLFRAQAETHPQALTGGMFGLGFTLRLAASEAKAAGGSLEREEDRLVLALPSLTGAQSNLSQS